MKNRSVREILDTNGAEDSAHPLVKPSLNSLNETKKVSKQTNNLCDTLKNELQEHECLLNEQKHIVQYMQDLRYDEKVHKIAVELSK
jgi:hypothetical protein